MELETLPEVVEVETPPVLDDTWPVEELIDPVDEVEVTPPVVVVEEIVPEEVDASTSISMLMSPEEPPLPPLEVELEPPLVLEVELKSPLVVDEKFPPDVVVVVVRPTSPEDEPPPPKKPPIKPPPKPPPSPPPTTTGPPKPPPPPPVIGGSGGSGAGA